MEINEKSEISIRTSCAEDLNFILRLENKQGNRENICQNTEKEHRELIRNEDVFHFVIEKLPSFDLIGYGILVGEKNPDNAFELRRIVIEPKGKGFGTQALKFIMDYTFSKERSHRLWLDVRNHNKRAQKLYESCGFVYEGTLRESAWVNDHYESSLVYSMLRSEYEKFK